MSLGDPRVLGAIAGAMVRPGMDAKMTPQDFLKAVGSSMEETCGLTYETLKEVASSFDQDGVEMGLAQLAGTSPAAYASDVADRMSLLRVSDEYPPDTAESYNLRQAALWQFAHDAQWPMMDGRVQGPDGLTVGVHQMEGVSRGQIEFGFLANPEMVGATPQMDIREAVAEGRANLDLVASQDLTLSSAGLAR